MLARAAYTLLLLVSVATVGCAQLSGVFGAAGDIATDVLLPVSQENALGKKLVKEVEKDLALHPSSAVQSYVKEVGGRITKAAKDIPAGIRFTFKVVDDDDSVNAFAMPGGYIYVYSGLLRAAEDEAELAAVLGHEVAHVTQRHVARRLIAAHGLEAVTAVALGENPGLLGQLAASVVNGGLLLTYGRDQEREADAVGVPYAARAGRDPNGMISFFEKLKKNEGSPMFAILQSHPLPSERIENCRRLIKSLGKVPTERAASAYASMQKHL
ncbi:MAG: M48 family metalloprotease [Myxococcota bacterium]